MLNTHATDIVFSDVLGDQVGSSWGGMWLIDTLPAPIGEQEINGITSDGNALFLDDLVAKNRPADRGVCRPRVIGQGYLGELHRLVEAAPAMSGPSGNRQPHAGRGRW